ncbi:MAG: hypothetical protein EU532_03250 [Promethearchaeota archaeon]|nr:MAG: hypothetical protein EU532_03250 [Candidatus Lokiarchaeota archaeon]
MEKEHLALLQKMTEQLTELIYINGIIATELIKITENSAAIRRGEDFLNKSNCVFEHNQLNRRIIEILKNYINKPEKIESLEKHVLNHLE